MDFSVGSKPLRPDERIISAIQVSQEKVVFVILSIYYCASCFLNSLFGVYRCG